MTCALNDEFGDNSEGDEEQPSGNKLGQPPPWYTLCNIQGKDDEVPRNYSTANHLHPYQNSFLCPEVSLHDKNSVDDDNGLCLGLADIGK